MSASTTPRLGFEESPRPLNYADVEQYHRDTCAAEKLLHGQPLQVRVARYLYAGRPCIVLRFLHGTHPQIAAQTIPLTPLTADQLLNDLREALKPLTLGENDLRIEDDGRDNWTDGELLPAT